VTKLDQGLARGEVFVEHTSRLSAMQSSFRGRLSGVSHGIRGGSRRFNRRLSRAGERLVARREHCVCPFWPGSDTAFLKPRAAVVDAAGLLALCAPTSGMAT
jgi:hypothetical protein